MNDAWDPEFLERSPMFEPLRLYGRTVLEARWPSLDDLQRLLDPGRLRSTRELVPLPILGVPGWCPDNTRESYYDNLDYFRAGRRR